MDLRHLSKRFKRSRFKTPVNRPSNRRGWRNKYATPHRSTKQDRNRWT